MEGGRLGRRDGWREEGVRVGGARMRWSASPTPWRVGDAAAGQSVRRTHHTPENGKIWAAQAEGTGRGAGAPPPRAADKLASSCSVQQFY